MSHWRNYWSHWHTFEKYFLYWALNFFSHLQIFMRYILWLKYHKYGGWVPQLLVSLGGLMGQQKQTEFLFLHTIESQQFWSNGVTWPVSLCQPHWAKIECEHLLSNQQSHKKTTSSQFNQHADGWIFRGHMLLFHTEGTVFKFEPTTLIVEWEEPWFIIWRLVAEGGITSPLLSPLLMFWQKHRPSLTARDNK